MNDRAKTGLGVSALLAVGAAAGIGGKAVISKIATKVKEHKAKKEEAKESK